MKVIIENEDGDRKTFIGVSDYQTGDGTVTMHFPPGADVDSPQTFDGEVVAAASLALHNVQGLVEVIADTDDVTVVAADKYLDFGTSVIHDAVDELRHRDDPEELEGVNIID